MRVILDYYFNDLEQHCLTEGCKFEVGPYSDPWHGACPYCQGRVGFFRAFGTEKERKEQVRHLEEGRML